MRRSSTSVALATFAAVLALAPAPVHAYELSPKALFFRCFGQLTQSRPAKDLPALRAVVDDGADPLAACLSVLATARLVANEQTTVADVNDPVAKSVLQTLHNLHASWFTRRGFPDFADPTLGAAIGDMYDTSTPAMYLTRSLFRPETPFSSVPTLDVSLAAVRTTNAPAAGAQTQKSKGSYVLNPSINFAATGELLGITDAPARVMTNGSVPYVQSRSLGGGILGDPVYLLENSAGSLDVKLDGAVAVVRRYSKAVMQDLLCLDLPAVREVDAAPFVVAGSSVPFRGSAGCTACHATIDRMAGVIRGLVYQAPPAGPGVMRGVFIDEKPVTAAAELMWPAQDDAQYSERPTLGTLYYRNHAGTLVDKPVDDLAALGQALAAEDEPYICVAKRYYRYFLGVDVNTGDPGNPAHPLATEGDMARHRRNVIRLGQELRQDQSLVNVIKKIISQPEYRLSGFAN